VHIHVSSPDGEAKFWLEPMVALATYSGFNLKELRIIQKTVEEKSDEFKSAWKRYFGC